MRLRAEIVFVPLCPAKKVEPPITVFNRMREREVEIDDTRLQGEKRLIHAGHEVIQDVSVFESGEHMNVNSAVRQLVLRHPHPNKQFENVSPHHFGGV